MSVESLVAVIAACTSMLTAIGGLVLASRQKETQKQVTDTHGIVNQQRTDMQRLLELYQQALQGASVPIPRDDSLARPTPEELKTEK